MTAGERSAARAEPRTTADVPPAPLGPVEEAVPHVPTPMPPRPPVTAATMIEARQEALDREQRFQQLAPARRLVARARVANGPRVRLASSADRQQDAS